MPQTISQLSKAQTKNDTYFCEENHHKFLVDYQTGEIVCVNCGFVKNNLLLDPKTDHFSPVQKSQNKSIKNKTPSNPFNPKNNKKLYFAQKNLTHGWKNFKQDLDVIHYLCEKNEIPNDLKNRAKLLLNNFQNKNVSTKKDQIISALACLYYEIQMSSKPIQISTLIQDIEFGYKSIINFSLLQSYYYQICSTLELQPPAKNPTIYIPYIISKYNLKIQVEHLSTQIAKQICKKFCCDGKKPLLISASIVYLASYLIQPILNLQDVSKNLHLKSQNILDYSRQFYGIINENLMQKQNDKNLSDIEKTMLARFQYF